jgi:hypothetical protein
VPWSQVVHPEDSDPSVPTPQNQFHFSSPLVAVGTRYINFNRYVPVCWRLLYVRAYLTSLCLQICARSNNSSRYRIAHWLFTLGPFQAWAIITGCDMLQKIRIPLGSKAYYNPLWNLIQVEYLRKCRSQVAGCIVLIPFKTELLPVMWARDLIHGVHLVFSSGIFTTCEWL